MNTPVEHSSPTTKAKKTYAKYRGVCWVTKYKKYMAQIPVDGKSKFLGYFLDAVEAAKAYDAAALETYGDEAKLNFKDGKRVRGPYKKKPKDPERTGLEVSRDDRFAKALKEEILIPSQYFDDFGVVLPRFREEVARIREKNLRRDRSDEGHQEQKENMIQQITGSRKFREV